MTTTIPLLTTDINGGDVVVVDVKTRAEVKRIPVGRGPEGILIVPDGTRAYVAVTGDNQIAVVDLATLTVTGRVTTGKGPDGMAWVQ